MLAIVAVGAIAIEERVAQTGASRMLLLDARPTRSLSVGRRHVPQVELELARRDARVSEKASDAAPFRSASSARGTPARS